MTIALLMLAAGASRRFGPDEKLLAPFDGEPLVVRSVRRIAGLGLPVTVVVAVGGGAVEQALHNAGLVPPVRVTVNPRAAAGIGTSIAAGLASLSADTEAVVILQADMPFVDADLIGRLVAAFRAASVPLPVHPVLPDGGQANPVLWPAAWFPQLAALDGDRGGKRLLEGAGALTIALGDPAAAADIDTAEDLLRLAAATGAAQVR